MLKILYYIYFGIYLFIKTIIAKVKTLFLKKESQKAVDEYIYHTAQGMCRHFMRISNTSSIVKGLENIPKEPCIFICNHQAIFDVFLLIPNIEQIAAFIAKKEIKSYPLIGFWITAMHSVYLDRSNVREGMKAINEGAENIKRGYSMILFPEGTRSLSSEMGEFKKGSLKLALKANAPIVPVTIDGTYKVLETGNQVRGNQLKLTVHKPIYVDQLSAGDKKDLSDIVYNIIKNGLGV